MFTGIIEETAEVLSITSKNIIVKRPKSFTELQLGQSIAVNGACLSVSDFDDQQMLFDVMSETWQKTNLSSASQVNLERAMPADGRFEGHIVLGHIDGTLPFLHKIQERSGQRYFFALPQELKKYLSHKGSIALNGISLTVAKINDDSFELGIIPLTEAKTNFASLKPGDMINYEADYLAKIIMNKNIV